MEKGVSDRNMNYTNEVNVCETGSVANPTQPIVEIMTDTDKALFESLAMLGQLNRFVTGDDTHVPEMEKAANMMIHVRVQNNAAHMIMAALNNLMNALGCADNG